MFTNSEKQLTEWLPMAPFEEKAFLQIAITLSEMVYRIHRQNVRIGGLSPANVRMSADRTLAELSETVEMHDIYQAPEQTGRINRTPDGRSDLYSLGVIFYELLTGVLPFQAQGETNWSYLHISAPPRPLGEMRPELEGPLQDIVLKLLAKSPEDRYQSAYGLLADLKQCARMLEQNGVLMPFLIGRVDEIREFRLPHNLFGRDEQMQWLVAGFELAAAGKSVFRSIRGVAGIGKTALINQFQETVARRGGRFVGGKGDPRDQDRPYEPVLQALRQWIEELWSEPTDTVASLKERLNARLGEEAQTIVACWPEACALLGDPAGEAPACGPAVAARFGELLPEMIGCMAEGEQSLVLYLDDLQWADVSTIRLLHRLARDEEIKGLMVIGASREEADSNWIADTADQTELPPLLYEDVRLWVSSVLHEDTARARLLARSMYLQTQGNPRSLRLLLENWRNEKKLIYDEKQHRWMWDAEVTKRMSESEESIRLVKAGFSRLSEETRAMLAIAAAIGPCFPPEMLAEVSGHSLEQTLHLLQAAEREGMICYEEQAKDRRGEERLYLFLHDQVWQMADSIYADRRADWHLKIGRLLQRQNSNWHDDALYETIDHLNLGMANMSDGERAELAWHNYRAGSKAISSIQYAKAKRYFETGLQLVESEVFESGSLVCKLTIELIECEHICGNIERAQSLLRRVMIHKQKLNLEDRIRVYTYLIHLATYDQNDKAVQTGREALAELGWKLPEKVSTATVIKEVLLTQAVLYRMRDKFDRLPPNEEVEFKAVSGLLVDLFTPLLIQDDKSLIALYAKFIRYGAKKGINEPFVLLLSVYELLLQRGLPQFLEGYCPIKLEHLQATSQLSQRFQPKLPFMIGFSKQLENPIEASIYLEKSLRLGVEITDPAFVNLAIAMCLLNHCGDVHALSKLLAYMEREPRPFTVDRVLELIQVAKAYLAALQDASLQDAFVAIPDPDRMDRAQDEEDNFSCGCRLEVAYLSGKYKEAQYWAKRCRENELAPDLLQVRKQRLYEALTFAACYVDATPDERKRTLRMLTKQMRLMRKRKGYLGADSAAHLLIRAEWKRICGDRQEAMQEYAATIERARQEKQGLFEAISYERLAVCYQEAGSRTGVTISLMDACTAYTVWGITAKAKQISSEHADVSGYLSTPLEARATEMEREGQDLVRTDENKVVDSPASLAEEDLLHQIVRWSVKPNDPNLLESFLTATLRQAGADRGLVIRSLSGSFQIKAQTGSVNCEGAASTYSEAVLRHVRMTGEALMIDDAARSYFQKDPYIRQCAPRSIICMPIVFPGNQPSDLLYLENTQVTGVFTETTRNVLELMITRMTYLRVLSGTTAEAGGEVPFPVVQPEPQALIEPLTNRETEILIALSEGLSNREIAERFNITEPTVKTHASNIYGKLGVRRRGQAVVRAKELQLISR
ncbi:hypothetical protein CIG75_02880 [Tumebacillus algifaecis]|uniref:HTH luxR-type domain-containing protein n=1 Tax=Tumebacillus algifaecis TaxID=1214604 RepID=A0A223CXI6_9BACL|nr:AAA family ATPase [Tumebacillus algifaecis]ASS74028.1 hypothetical protein CIG75_02880 [Tumebacillus algifaecis]